jgi:hypothetical protein
MTDDMLQPGIYADKSGMTVQLALSIPPPAIQVHWQGCGLKLLFLKPTHVNHLPV